MCNHPNIILCLKIKTHIIISVFIVVKCYGWSLNLLSIGGKKMKYGLIDEIPNMAKVKITEESKSRHSIDHNV